MNRPNRLKMDISGETTPRNSGPEKGKPFLVLVIILILAAVVVWFWMARDPDSRQKLDQGVQAAASSVQNVLSSVREQLGGTPAPPEIGSVAGGALPGAPDRATPQQVGGADQNSGDAAGQVTSGADDTPVADPSATGAESGSDADMPGGAESRGTMAAPGETMPGDAGRQDDAVVRVAFIDDLAKWLVDGYQPGNRKGYLAVNLQAANLRYGAGMRGLAWIGDDLPKGRAAALEYVFTPNMLSALYKLYINRFMGAMLQFSAEPLENGKTLNEAQRKEMYKLYAARFRGISGALQGAATLSDLTRRVDGLNTAIKNVVTANSRYSELVFAFDEAREQKESGKSEELRQRVDAASRVYQQAVVEREQTASALARAIRQNPAARALEDDTLLYVASWVDRRVRKNPQAVEAAFQGATLFLELAQRFEQAANGPENNAGNGSVQP